MNETVVCFVLCKMVIPSESEVRNCKDIKIKTKTTKKKLTEVAKSFALRKDLCMFSLSKLLYLSLETLIVLWISTAPFI